MAVGKRFDGGVLKKMSSIDPNASNDTKEREQAQNKTDMAAFILANTKRVTSDNPFMLSDHRLTLRLDDERFQSSVLGDKSSYALRLR